MRALIRNDEVILLDGSETKFVHDHWSWMCGMDKNEEGCIIPGDGWMLVENYEPVTEQT